MIIFERENRCVLYKDERQRLIDPEIRCYDDKEFAEKAKKIMIKSNLSLGDLIRLPPKEAKKLITFKEYFDFLIVWHLPEGPREACLVQLCETLSRGFFQSWAMEPFRELIHYRLPLLCCDMIDRYVFLSAACVRRILLSASAEQEVN
ncbi:hypothetical protein ACDT20_13910, partial [Staphylococcus aureus]